MDKAIGLVLALVLAISSTVLTGWLRAGREANEEPAMNMLHTFMAVFWLSGVICAFRSISTRSSYTLGQSPTVSITATQPDAYGGIIEVEQGQDVTINCFVENLQVDTLVRWQKTYKNNQGRTTLVKISADTSVEDNTKVSIEKPTYFTWRLRLKSVSRTDTGNYSCYVMTTRQNRREANMTVRVFVPPTLDPERTSSDTVAREGDNIDMLCNATGYPPPTVEWSRLGGALLPIGKERHFDSTMTITNVKSEDRGKYRCRVYNTIGSVRRDVTLDVRFRPKVEPQRAVVKQAPGYVIELQCLVSANPFPRDVDLRWYRGTRSLSVSSGRYKIQHVDGAFNRMTYELTFNPVDEEDYGEYTCQIKNTEGTSSARIKLERSDVPQPSIKLGRVISGSSSAVVSIATFLMCFLVIAFH